MSGLAAVLRDLHRLRRHARELQDQIERGPRVLKAHEAKVARQEEILREAHDALKHLKVKVHEKEGELKTTHQHIAKLTKQLNEAAGKKEYDALQHEIAADKQTCAKLEDEILTGMGEIEEGTARIPEQEKAIQSAKDELVRYKKDSEGRLAEFKVELEKTNAELHEREQVISSDVRQHYDRLVAARGDDAMSSTVNRTCIACHTEITAQMHNDLLSGRLVTCKACDRLLYLPE